MNLNLLLVNPLTLLAGGLAMVSLIAGPAARGVARAWAYLWALHALLLAAVGGALSWVFQDVSQPAALLAPIHLALAGASLRCYLASARATALPSRNAPDGEVFDA